MDEKAIDPFGRRIEYFRVSVTDRCNLKCVYCSPGGRRLLKDSEILTSPEILRVVRIALGRGLRRVRLTGGEPLLRGDIVALVSALKSAGVRDLSLTTNAVLLAEMAADLKKAGLDRVNISLDTLRPERYRSMTGGSDINRIWDAVEEATRAGLAPVKINAVPLRGINEDEIPDFAALTFKNDFHIRFIEYMPIGRKIMPETVRMTKDEIMGRVSALGRLTRLPFKGGGPSRNYRLEGARGIIGFISPMSDHFCRYCNRLRLTPEGKIRPCLLEDMEIDIKAALRGGMSDEGLESVFDRALMSKPAGHTLTPHYKSRPTTPMSRIGG